MKVLCIGKSSYETTTIINNNLVDGMKLELTDRFDCGAGISGNIAYLLGKWGVETYIASILGSDDAASKIKKEFENIGVKIDYLETSYDKPTGTLFSLVNNTTKNTTIFEIPNISGLKKYAFAIEPDVIVTDGSELNASLQAFDKFQKAISILVAKKNTNQVQELSRYANYIIYNKSNAEAISEMKIDYNNSGTIVNVFNKLKQKNSKAEIIITLGERGSVYSINGQVKIMPPIGVNIVDVNGAGDTFAGAFTYGLGRNFGLEKSICYATIAASLSVTKIGSRLSIPTITEVSSYYDNKFGAQNNPNNQVSQENVSPTQVNNQTVNTQQVVNNNIQPAMNQNTNMTQTQNSGITNVNGQAS